MADAPTPMLPVQGALIALLRGDTALKALAEAVYDYLPETVPYPFIVVGEATETADNSHDRYGRQTVVTLHVWSKYRGYAQVLRIGARINALLDHQPLTIPGLDHVVTRYEFSQTLTDSEPPGDIRHLVVRYRIITEQPPA